MNTLVNTMVIKFYIVWFLLMWVGFLLLTLRNDYYKIRKEIEFVIFKGTIYHKITIIVLAPIVLPISIYFSIRNIKNK
jgi:hypothetical protein